METGNRTTQQPDAGRREFLLTLGRYSAFLGVVAGAGVLVARGGGLQAACERDLRCGGCPIFGGCQLPERRHVDSEGAAPRERPSNRETS